jgi:large subunit ribosomal protein L25
MKTVSVSGSPRENVGKKDAKSLRRQELVPCVIYGGKEQVNLTLPLAAFRDIIYTPESCLIKLEVGKKTYDVILQDAQFHPVTDKVIHADFLQIFPDKPVKIDVPVNITGNSPGVIKGGKLTLKLRKLRVQGLMAALPDKIDVNISKLEIGDSVKVNQLSTEGLTFLNYPTSVVALVKTTRGAGAGVAGDEDEGEESEGASAGEQATEEPKAE